MSYDKTIWQDNITIVDAEKLNKIEDNLFDVSVSTLNIRRALDIIEEKMDMKSNNGHRHPENATTVDLELLRDEFNIVENEFNKIKDKIQDQMDKVEDKIARSIDDAEIDENNVLHLYSNGNIFKSLEHKNKPVIKASISAPTDSTQIWIDTNQ